jgi:glucose/mannose-6-phosphate isomerase
MNLDQHQEFQTIDQSNMLQEIIELPEQLQKAWELGQKFPLSDYSAIRQILVAGMGGSAIGASLVKAYSAPQLKIPLEVHRDYKLPAWASGPETLVVASSHSGNTEETRSAFDTAQENGCRLLVITTGGALADMSQAAGCDLWQFEHNGQPRAAVGYSFGLLLALLNRLGLIPDQNEEIQQAYADLLDQRALISPEIKTAKNPAKREAGQIVDRWISVFGADYLAPVARRWKGQISEVAKAWAQFEALPEADHNTLAGVVNPEQVLLKTMTLFLRSDFNHARNQRRVDLTKKNFMLEGLNTDLVEARGSSRLSQMWTLIHFGDFLAYYLAMMYGVDPTPVAAIENLKSEL